MRRSKQDRRRDSIERKIELALSLGDFIDYAAAWSFVSELEEVETRIAAKVYRALGMRILNAKKSKYYNAALSHFEQTKQCYRTAGLDPLWDALVDEIRQTHRRKSAFMPGFE